MTDPTRAAELTAAVERLRRTIKYGGGEYVDDVYDNEDAVARSQRHLDEQLLVKHVLATVAADEQLTVEWAKSRCYFCGEERDGFVEVLQIENYHFDDAHTCSSEVKLKTRGDFLQLCKLLNIALTPIGQEAGK